VQNFLDIYSSVISVQRDVSVALADSIRSFAETGTLAPSLLVLALVLGAIHALTPGHGKSIILSYFIGQHELRMPRGGPARLVGWSQRR
jgi:ABC-type nickel/cobalt efflux system permease component RcnA